MTGAEKGPWVGGLGRLRSAVTTGCDVDSSGAVTLGSVLDSLGAVHLECPGLPGKLDASWILGLLVTPRFLGWRLLDVSWIPGVAAPVVSWGFLGLAALALGYPGGSLRSPGGLAALAPGFGASPQEL